MLPGRGHLRPIDRRPADWFGFDGRTNRAEPCGRKTYWDPPAAGKRRPSYKTANDGAVWVSVGAGLAAQVRLDRKGPYSAGCLKKCRDEIVNSIPSGDKKAASVAEVVGPLPNAQGASVVIKGCDGREVG